MTPRTTALALAAMIAATLPASATDGPVSLLGEGRLGQGRGRILDAAPAMPVSLERGPSIAILEDGPEDAPRRAGSSLFIGAASGFFAPLPPREDGTGQRYRDLGGTTAIALGPNASDIERLRHLIGHAEAGADGYDAINYGARRLPARRPTEMTLGEIYAWIEATPGQPHAIGRFQFIPSTLKRLARQIGAGAHERFSPALQDRLADELFAEAGLHAYREGLMGQTQFMNNLAKIWAGLPNSSGKSHYHGYAGNRATMTWAHFDAEMAKIFPS